MENLELEGVDFARKYVAILYKKGDFIPGKYRYVPGFGDLSRENIDYLIESEILDKNLQPARLKRNGKESRFIFDRYNRKPEIQKTDIENSFTEEFRKSQTAMSKIVDDPSTDDIINHMRLGQPTNNNKRLDMAQRRKFVAEYESENGEMSKEDVETLWSEINEKLEISRKKDKVALEQESLKNE